MTYSKDLCTLVITYQGWGRSLAETASALDLSISTVVRIRRCWMTPLLSLGGLRLGTLKNWLDPVAAAAAPVV